MASIDFVLYIGKKWRTKYEMQANLNWKLEDEIETLNRRVIEANQLLKDSKCFAMHFVFNIYWSLSQTHQSTVILPREGLL